MAAHHSAKVHLAGGRLSVPAFGGDNHSAVEDQSHVAGLSAQILIAPSSYPSLQPRCERSQRSAGAPGTSFLGRVTWTGGPGD